MHTLTDPRTATTINEYGHLTARTIAPADIDALKAAGETLPAWDNWGYEIAYYVATAAEAADVSEDGHTVCYRYMMLNGEIAIRDHTGDVLCAACATANETLGADEILYAAYQVNGEIGDTEAVHCDHCNATIYAPATD
jgi:hypothetical protein